MPSRTAPSRPMPPNSEVGQPTVNTGCLKPPAAIACAPRPYPLRSTTVPVGTLRLAPMVNIRAKWRTVAVRSAAGPTMNPGVSQRNRIGRANASHRVMNRAALSAPWASIAPPRWVGSLAITPSGRPPERASAVRMPRPKPRRSSSTEPASNRPSITAPTS